MFLFYSLYYLYIVSFRTIRRCFYLEKKTQKKRINHKCLLRQSSADSKVLHTPFGRRMCSVCFDRIRNSRTETTTETHREPNGCGNFILSFSVVVFIIDCNDYLSNDNVVVLAPNFYFHTANDDPFRCVVFVFLFFALKSSDTGSFVLYNMDRQLYDFSSITGNGTQTSGTQREKATKRVHKNV